MPDRRGSTLIAALVAAPAIVAGLAVLVLEAGRVAQPQDPLFATPAPASFGDAILGGDVEAAYGYLRNGTDPNTTLTIHLPEMPRGHTTRLTPMTLAVAARNVNAVTMLLGAKVQMERPENRLALCLARERGDTAIAGMLERVVTEPLACPERALAD
jgi:hypothetical protein